MSKTKKIFKYIIWLIVFFIFSELLINVGLNSTYKPLTRKDQTKEVSIYQAEATKVNGRIRGIVINTGATNINGKYIKIDIYSPRDVNLGTKYIDINNLEVGKTQAFEVFYKIQNSSHYSVSIVDKKEEVHEDISKLFLAEDLSNKDIWVLTFLTFLLFK